MLALGLATSIMVDRAAFGTRQWAPQFLSIQLSDLINFGILAAFALRLRGDSASHKRLMLLATVCIVNAGFIRWWGPHTAHWFDHGYLSELTQMFLSDFLIVGVMIAYDLATRGRPNRGLTFGAPLVVGVEMLAVFLYFNPNWITFTGQLLRP
jgi:hypothetical protein